MTRHEVAAFAFARGERTDDLKNEYKGGIIVGILNMMHPVYYAVF